jgi:addiction module RelB/DinJ family antitoxin
VAESILSVRVDEIVKRNAETAFNELGMNINTGINIFLTRVARSGSIPFALEPDGDPLDIRMRRNVEARKSDSAARGVPTALFDSEKNRPYLEYPDGRRVYELD